MQSAYEAVKPEDIPGKDEVKPERAPSEGQPIRSTIPQSSASGAAAKPLASESATSSGDEDKQSGNSRDASSTTPVRRSLLVRKPQGFSAEDSASSTITGGVTAVPNTGNIQKVRAPLPGETSAIIPDSDELTKPAEVSAPEEKLSATQENLQLPGVKAHTSRFRRVTKNEFSHTKKPHPRDEQVHKSQRKGNQPSRWGKWERKGWIPGQKGAYAMALLPYWIGVIESSLRPVHWLVFALWICGYLLFMWGESGCAPTVKTATSSPYKFMGLSR